MDECASEETVARFVEGQLPPDEVRVLEGHMAGCQSCRMLVEAAAGMLAGSVGDDARLTPEKDPAGLAATMAASGVSQGGAAIDARDAWSPPTEFDEYRVTAKLGRGAMGQVLLARDTLLDRLVAVKFMAARLDGDEALRERFLVEARAIARLQHPNVVAIHRVGQVDGHPYLVSEFVHGQSLDRLPKPVTAARAIEIGIALARGLAAAHRRNVLHRDIKPANAIVSDVGEVKLLDFGLAKLLDTGGPPSSGAPPSPPPVMPDATPVGVTTPGMVIGTPLYLAPELWSGETASRASDIYSLGVLLYELCSGGPPHVGIPFARLGRAAAQGAPSLAVAASTVDARLCAIVDRCLRVRPEERFSSGDELRDALEPLALATGAAEIPEGNPYRGLQAFGAEHRALFFGRGAEARAVLDRLRAESFVLVAGDSGVGKSSLCAAGVVPLVEEGNLEVGGFGRVEKPGARGETRDRRRWRTLRLVPGRRPIEALATAVASLGLDEASLAAELRAQPSTLGRAVRRAAGSDAGTLVFVDQLEELLTLAPPDEAALAGEALGALAASGSGVRLLATVRGDFLTRLAALSPLGEEVSRALYLLRPLAKAGLREAIEGPARAKGVSFESPELVDELVIAAERAEGGLPLLQFALAELWEARDRTVGLIRASSLAAIGGVEGALARHADGVLATMLLAERAAARRLLLRLVTAEGTRTRRRAPELLGTDGHGVDPAARGALEALVRGRLVVARESDGALRDAGEEERGGGSYEIAHEALVRGWSTLRGWLTDDAVQQAARERLDRAVAEWERLGRRTEALWSGHQLAETALLDPLELDARARTFLDASRRAARRKRSARIALLVAAPLALGTIYGGVQLKQRLDLDGRIAAHRDAAERTLQRAHAEDAATLEHRRVAFARFDAARDAAGREAAEKAWSEALAAAAETDRTYSAAAQSLESALLLDGGRHDLRRLYADLLVDRAVLADRDHRRSQRDDLLAHLPTYDQDKRAERRWKAPAHVTITSTPPGASVTASLYQEQGGRLVPLPSATLGKTPLTDVELQPGSWLLLITAEGRAPVRYPLLVERDERFRSNVPLPEHIPDGYVYIAPGRFLYGSSGDEELRRAFTSQPLRTVTTGPYLMGRTEVTFGEWLEFLRTLPLEERERRRPHGRDYQGSVDVTELPDGRWRIAIQPTTQLYVARTGEPIRYLQRSRRAVQDWLRLPAAGISFDDARAYFAWLDRTGRLPGARACTEYEWERAARGADDRIYPHGNQLAADDADFDATYGRLTSAFGPDEVGSHPASDSPFGVADLAGNVWEFVSAADGSGELELRGGGWYEFALLSRSNNREPVETSTRTLTVGVRICAGVWTPDTNGP